MAVEMGGTTGNPYVDAAVVAYQYKDEIGDILSDIGGGVKKLFHGGGGGDNIGYMEYFGPGDAREGGNGNYDKNNSARSNEILKLVTPQLEAMGYTNPDGLKIEASSNGGITFNGKEYGPDDVGAIVGDIITYAAGGEGGGTNTLSPDERAEVVDSIEQVSNTGGQPPAGYDGPPIPAGGNTPGGGVNRTPEQILSDLIANGGFDPENNPVGLPGTPSGGGGTDVSGNPYDPEMERVYGERNPGYPNPYSLPDAGGTSNDGGIFGEGTILGDVFGPDGPFNQDGGQPGGWEDALGGVLGNILGPPANGRDGNSVFGNAVGAAADSEAQQRWFEDNVARDPNDLNIPGFGDVRYDNGQSRIDNLNPAITNFQNRNLALANSELTDPNVNGIVDQTRQYTNDELMNVFNDAQNSRSFIPQQDAANQRFEGLFDQASQGGANANQWAGEARDFGNDLLSNNDFGDMASDRLRIQRERTDPYNTMSRNNLNQNLFNTGNSLSKGGAMQHGALDLAQGTNDLTSQLEAQNFAEKQRQFNITGGTNLYNTAGSLTNAGTNASNVAGGMNDANARTNIAATGAENTRMNQRLQNAQELFGFGEGARQNQINNSNNAYANASQPFNQYLDAFEVAANTGRRGSAATNAQWGANNRGASSEQQLFDILKDMGIF